MPDESASSSLRVERIVLKDLSFETPMGQGIFDKQWQPEYSVNLELHTAPIADNTWEVVLSATITARLAGEIAYLIEAQQAGVIELAPMDIEPRRRALAIEAPRLVFPYLRETVDSVTARGGFPAVGLQPPDFEAWFEGIDQPAAATSAED